MVFSTAKRFANINGSECGPGEGKRALVCVSSTDTGSKTMGDLACLSPLSDLSCRSPDLTFHHAKTTLTSGIDLAYDHISNIRGARAQAQVPGCARTSVVGLDASRFVYFPVLPHAPYPTPARRRSPPDPDPDPVQCVSIGAASPRCPPRVCTSIAGIAYSETVPFGRSRALLLSVPVPYRRKHERRT